MPYMHHLGQKCQNCHIWRICHLTHIRMTFWIAIYGLHFTDAFANFILHIVHCKLHWTDCILKIIHFRLNFEDCTLHIALCIFHFAACIWSIAICNLQNAHKIMHFSDCTLWSTLHFAYSISDIALYKLRSTEYTL